MASETFTSVAQTLLTGEMICETVYPNEYQFLQNDINTDQIEKFLAQIDRGLACTQDGRAYYCAFLDVEESGAKTAIRQVFREVAQDLEPLLRWMRFVREANAMGQPVESGMLVKQSELLQAVESSPAKYHELNELTKSGFFKSSARNSSAKIDQILGKLKYKGFLVAQDTSGALFRATGLWSYLYDVLDFIRAHEHLESDDDGNDQPELL